MAYGLETRSGDNKAQITIASRLARFVGSYTFSGTASTGASVAGMVNNGTWVGFSASRGVTITIGSGSFSCSSAISQTYVVLIFRT